MFKAIFTCIKRVIGTLTGFGGTVSSIIGALSEWLKQPIAVPGWAWIVLGSALLFATACRIEWELLQEKDKNRKSEPDMTFEQVIERIRGKKDIFGPENSESLEVSKAFRSIEERAASGALVIFGSKGIRSLDGLQRDTVGAMLKRLPIPADFWSSNSFDYLSFIEDRSGATTDTTQRDQKFGSGYGNIWLDSKQVNSIWPEPRKRIAWSNPIRFAN
jgi:hypothetical protein